MTLQQVIAARPHPYTFACMNIAYTKQVVTIPSIEKAVCDYYKINPEKIHTTRRHRDIVKVRQIIMFLSKQLTNHYLSDIGRL